MTVRWKPSFDKHVSLVVKELVKQRKQRGHHVKLHWHLNVVPLLITGIAFGTELSEEEQRDIVTKSLMPLAGLNETISEEALMKRIRNYTAPSLRRKLKKYSLITDWCLRDRPRHTRSIFGAKLHIGYQHSRALVTARERGVKDLGGYPELPKNANYCPVRVDVVAKSIHAAYNKAFEAQDLVRGIRNLILNRGSTWVDTPRPPKPINKVLAGPLHSVTRSVPVHGECLLWYEPDYPMETWPDSWSAGAHNLETRMLSRIRSTKHGHRVAEGIVRYSRALDKPDVDGRFLSLWGALEYLTGTEKGIAYDKTVKRGAFVGTAGDYDIVVLNYLRDHRNDLAHRGRGSNLRIRHTFQLKRYVERLIQFHLQHCLTLDTWEDLLAVLDSPTDSVELTSARQQLATRRKIVAIASSRLRS